VAELPYFDAVAKEYADKVTIVAVDIQEEASQVKNFLQKLFDGNEVSFTVALDKDAQVASAYSVGRYIPVTFLIDSQGIVRYAKLGAFPNEKNLQDSIALLLES
jgi:peroxiredoxin